MKLIPSFEGLSDAENIKVVEFDRLLHMQFAKDVMNYDEELTKSQLPFNIGEFDNEESYGKISYTKYIDLMLNNNWRLFIILLDNKCIGYIHISPGKYKNSVYVGSFMITKTYTGKGYGKLAFIQLENLVKHDYSIIMLNVALNNKHAVKLYERVGLKPSHVMMSKKLK